MEVYSQMINPYELKSPIQQQSAQRSTPTGGVTPSTDTTPENVKHKDTLGNIANIANTVDTGYNLYEFAERHGWVTTEDNSNVQSTGSSQSSSGTSSIEPSSKPEDAQQYVDENIVFQNPSSEPTASTSNYMDSYRASLEQSSYQDNKLENSPEGVNFSDLASGKQSAYVYTKNPDGTFSVQTKGINTPNGPTEGSFLGNVRVDWQTARQVAMPALTYAAGYSSMDSTNKWLQGGKTLQRISQAFAGRDANGMPNKTVLDDYYISNFVELADTTYNWADRGTFDNAMTAANTGMNLIKNLDAQEAVFGSQGTFNQVQDGLAMINFGNSIYQLTNNWDTMNDGERTAASLQTMLVGMQMYDKGSSLATAFTRAADVATPVAAGGSAAANVAAASSGGATVASSGGAVATSASGGVATAAGTEVAGVGTSAGGGTMLASGEVVNAAGEVGTEVGSNVVVEGGAVAAEEGSTILGGYIIPGVQAVLGAYAMYQGINGMSETWGKDTASARTGGAIAGAAVGSSAVILGSLAAPIASAIATGAAIGSCVPLVGTIIGAAVGAVIGVCTATINAGKSKFQARRDNWRATYENAGVFQMAGNGSHVMKLADGQYYDVGIDGKDSYATYINGAQKTWANIDKAPKNDDGSVRKMNPYDVDYTNSLDVLSGSLVNSMILPVGGSYALHTTRELRQMLGYMANGVTSNCGRTFSLQNFNTMISNVKQLYSTIGITNKDNMCLSLAEAYATGKITLEDYQAGLNNANIIYDENGYQIAAEIMGEDTSTVADTTVTDTTATE